LIPFTSSDLYSNWKNQLASSQSKIVIINRGINEALNGVDNATFTNQLTSLVDIARKMGKLVILETPNAATKAAGGINISSATASKAQAVRDLATTYNVLWTDGYAISNNMCSAAYYTDYNDASGASCIHPTKTLYGMLLSGANGRPGLTSGTLGKNGVTGIGSDDTTADVKGVVGAAKMFNLTTAVTRLYVALFNRAPDVSGLSYWVHQIRDQNYSLNYVATAMYNAPESQAIYGGLTNDQIVTKFYNNVLGRFGSDIDQAGRNYWNQQLATMSVPAVLSNIIFAVAEYDAATANPLPSGVPDLNRYFVTGKTDLGLYSQRYFNNKVAVGLYYATILNKSIVNGDVSPFKNVLLPVTDDIKTVFTANDNAAGNIPR
jgi:hypothetical protein